MTVTLTEIAELRLRGVLGNLPDDRPERGVRLLVKSGGCQGYEYDIKIANAPREDDETLQCGSLRVFVDRRSAPLLEGIVVDFIDGLMDGGFKFINPNATTCSCGKSFQPGGCPTAGLPCS